MKLKCVLLTISCLAFFACSRDEITPEPETGKSELTVKLEVLPFSRAAIGDEIITGDIRNIHKLTLAVEGTDGNMLALKEVLRWTDESRKTETDDWKTLTNSSGDGLRIELTDGVPQKVHAFGNNVTVGIADGRLSYTAKLSEQTGSEVMYYGTDDDLELTTIDTGDRLTRKYTATIDCSPGMSRFQITEFYFEVGGSAEITKIIDGEAVTGSMDWSEFEGELMGVYLNNFYSAYKNGKATDLFRNNSKESIKEGTWRFNEGKDDAAQYASYMDYNGNKYKPMPKLLGKCYGFNFFVGDELPVIHFDVRNLKATFRNYDERIFDPKLFPESGFATIAKYYKTVGDESVEMMTPQDFKPGTLYNMQVRIKPHFVTGDIFEAENQLSVKVTIKEWTQESLTPGFEPGTF